MRVQKKRSVWLSACAALGFCASANAVDVSQPVVLQYFESTYQTLEYRMADVHAAGYGRVYTPPPGRADSGNLSVGYDVYDRFDLGGPSNSTLYGTETGLKTVIKQAQRAGLMYGLDLVWNHNGFSDAGTAGGSFNQAGGYPGFVLTGGADGWGDFHNPAIPNADSPNTEIGRLSGLLDIAQEKNNLYIRSPIGPHAQNVPAGTIIYNNRQANVPNAANIRFYPDTSNAFVVNDPALGANNVPIYNFNVGDPSSGDAVAENATGYLMRYTRWLVQEVGADFFRMDATKNMPSWVLNYYDRSVFRASNRTYLNGQQMPVWAFGEAYDGNPSVLQARIRKDYNAASLNTVTGNRDTKDFPFFFAVRDNLGNTPTGNNWNNLVNQSIDTNDDGLMNGSQGMRFVSSADDFGPYLDNVAHAYMLMMPGEALVYYNAQQFGTNRSFPKKGRSDALGGAYGETITELVDLRNRYGRGDYKQRLLENNQYAFEREKSALVMLSNRVDGTVINKNIPTAFPQGTLLVELTGNAGSGNADPTGQIPKVLVVGAGGVVAGKFLPNHRVGTATFTGAGYLVYGLATPQGTLNIAGNTGSFAGSVPNVSGSPDSAAFNNATTRLSNIPIIKGNSFTVNLNTTSVTLNNYGTLYRDQPADGDNALLKIDDGLNINGNAGVDFTNPAADVLYGFEQFVDIRTPGYTSPNGAGTYSQSIDAAQLAEGYHYITARVFRYRNDSGPAVFTDWRQTVYVDRLPPASGIFSFDQNGATSASRQLRIQSIDGTANTVHTFLDLPATFTDAQILAMVGGGNQAGQIDRDLFAYGYSNVGSGYHTITTVTYENTGTFSVQRFTGVALQTSRGIGIGDAQFDNDYDGADVNGANGFETALYSQGTIFNAAADLNADGSVDNRDLWKLPGLYVARGASAATVNAAKAAVRKRGDFQSNLITNGADIDALYLNLGSTAWTYDMDVSGGPADQADVDTLVRIAFGSEYGDTNINGVIDSTDFNTFAANYGNTNRGWAQGDFTGDRKVNTLDFNLLAGNFGFVGQGPNGIPEPWVEPSATLGSTVPEPALLGIVGVLFLVARAPRAWGRGASR